MDDNNKYHHYWWAVGTITMHHDEDDAHVTMTTTLLPTSARRASLLMLAIAATGCRPTESLAFPQFTINHYCHSSSLRQRQLIRHHCPFVTSARSVAESNSVITEQQDKNESEKRLCYYKRIDGSWKPRKELKDLRIGERLFASRLPERSVRGC